MSWIRGFAAAGATVLVMGGGAALGVSAVGHAGSICGSSEVVSRAAVSRVEVKPLPAQLVPAGSSLVTIEAPGLLSTKQTIGGGIDCAEPVGQVAPVQSVSEPVQQAAWLVRELAGGPPHCAVV